MQSYGQQPYGAPQQQYGQQYGQEYGSHPEGQQYGSPHQDQYDAPQQQPGPRVMTQNEFLSRVSAIRRDIDGLTTNIQNVATLHQQALASSDNGARQALDDLVAATQLKNTSIRGQLQQLKADAERTTDGTFGTKKRQFDILNDDFKKKIQELLQEEQHYKARYRDQIARQYRIVNPDATEEQVQQAADADWGDEGIFQTAVCLFALFFLPPVTFLCSFTDTLCPSHSSEPTAPVKPRLYWAICGHAITTWLRLSKTSCS